MRIPANGFILTAGLYRRNDSYSFCTRLLFFLQLQNLLVAEQNIIV